MTESTRLVRRAAAVAALIAVAAACGSSTSSGKAATGSTSAGRTLPAAQLALVAYSTPQEAYDKIVAAFNKTSEGKNITFTKSFGASGDQSRAVESGLAADDVSFSLEPDMTRLVKKGIVAPTWNADPYKGMITDSVVVLVVRKGNPKHIQTWADLTKPGVEVITANPFTSGGARWNVMAAYGQAVKAQGGSDQAGRDYLAALFKNVPVQDDSARKSLQTFTSGKGDVLLAYENEAIFAQQKGQAIDYVTPESTILIENPAAVTANSKSPEQAKAFLDYLHGTEAQTIFAEAGYRPVLPGVKSPYPFPKPAALFTIADFGGWADVSKTFFDPAGSVMADVEKAKGVSVG
ncbi:MAG TPA: sulfate ABC transporter substrate-binding protein [Acidimicrobiales bacterium]|jgi:sulfate transport system substrate-binding protein|nr:sulfate ABC transporter substrate-binding protein [Acidimicrobiales bacterium]